MLNYIDNNGNGPTGKYSPQTSMGVPIEAGVQELPDNNTGGNSGSDPGQGPVYYEVKKKRQSEQKDPGPNILLQLAEQLMTKTVVTFYPDTLVNEAWKVFQSVSFRHVPVIDNNNKLTGMVSYNSLLQKIHDISDINDDRAGDLRVKELMFKNVLVVRPDTPIRSIALNLFNKNIGAMPVTDVSGNLKGIITRSDILKAFFIKKSAIDLKG